jgi:hypothetical protein
MDREIPEMSEETLQRLSLLKDRLGHLHKLLHKYYTQSLHRLEEKAASYGVMDVPLVLQNQIEETRSKIKELEDEIKQVERSITEIKEMVRREGKEKQTREEEKALLSRFWQIRDDEPLFCAISTVGHEDTGKYLRRATGFGEIRGYASIVYSLDRAYAKGIMKDARLYFSDTFPQDRRLERSLILLGGDDKNDVTCQMMRHFELQGKKWPFRFYYEKDERGKDTGFKCLIVQDAEGVESTYNPKYEEVRTSGSDRKSIQVVQDFGVVAKLPNPINPYSKLYIFAGCHTYGTAAAAKAVAAKSILRRIEEVCPYYLTSKFFVSVIRCIMTNENFFHVDRMEIFYPLDEKTLRPISEGVIKDVDFSDLGDLVDETDFSNT